ncbi:hypothetical protein Sjap_014604 [Stephania japonica]|uniref:Uncharacterized protein n=1 Tax=Stephania japonica TaxID=461633 RepID=A0AAP0NQ45_9MAGN
MPPPPPPPCPSPPPPPLPPITQPTPKQPPPPPKPRKPKPTYKFENKALEISFHVIQNFKKKITDDPLGIKKTWTGPDVCSYRGHYCEAPPKMKERRVASIDFNGFGFANKDKNLPLKDFIDKLPDLAIFHANSNNFTGAIPQLSHLKYLYELDLSNNKIPGPFPLEVLKLNLSFLDIRFNLFTGSIPPQLFALDLDVLFLNNNNFPPQHIPENLGSTRVLYLTLANNNFTGSVPKTLGTGDSALILKEALFLNNKLSGCLPYQIGLLKTATVLDFGGNLITGPIPLSFGCLTSIQLFNLARNLLYGEVPEVLCELPRLQNLTLSFNYFTQVGPVCRSLLKRGVLDMKMNCVKDLPNQRSAKDCALFFQKPWHCPDQESMKISPCNKNNRGVSSGAGAGAGGSSSSAYSALKAGHGRHRHAL